jgi:hypothetical protein
VAQFKFSRKGLPVCGTGRGYDTKPRKAFHYVQPVWQVNGVLLFGPALGNSQTIVKLLPGHRIGR